jgi:uncharacterized protein with NAD-binding domain and iron-sulfur cluster
MRRRIAVLGGGMSSLAAVYELTSQPGWRDHLDITVYQMGHRLGGKGASSCNPEAFNRVEEHGLHVFWGFYENAFRMMRECYDELGRPSEAPLSSFEQAFKPHDLIVVPEKLGDRWEFWPLRMPRNKGVPGSGLGALDDPEAYVPRLLQLATWLLEGAAGVREWAPRVRAALRKRLPELRRLLDAVDRSLSGVRARSIAALDKTLMRVLRTATRSIASTRAFRSLSAALLELELAELLAAESGAVGPQRAQQDRREIVFLLDHVVGAFSSLLGRDGDNRRLRIQVDLCLTAARGLLADGLALPPRDWTRLDDESLRQWFRRHGAAEETVSSALLEGMHAAAYATGIDIAAGTALHAILRMVFTYKGAILYKMQAGMGEAVIAPLYQVLARRGVRFEFFQTVTKLELSTDRTRVSRIRIDRQATPKNGYQPLVEVDGVPCWPPRPLYDQLVEGEALRHAGHDLESWWTEWPAVEQRVLEHGRDFDAVILGISLGALREVGSELAEHHAPFAQMLENVATTPTQSAQLWLGPELPRLGWEGPPPIVIPYAEPMDTWADMTHLLKREARPPEASAGCLVYVTARLDDDEPLPPRGPSDYPDRQRARIRANTESWLRRSAGSIWPRSTTRHDPNQLNWYWLVDPEGRDGSARLDAQYMSPLRNPSDRYVLSLPGTTRFRLRPHASGFENLILAGDWTRTSWSCGCVEGAVMSGIEAARVLDASVRRPIGDWLGRLEEERRAEAIPEARLAASGGSPPGPPLRSLATRRDLPRYVRRDGELLAVPPIALGIDVHMFLLRADPQRLTELLDKHLNHGGPQVYRPLSSLAVLYCSRVHNYPIKEPFGWVPELDFGIWIPAIAGEMRGGVFRPDRLVTFTPYIWVSNDVALTNGRSFFGFTKDIGVMTMPARLEDASEFTLDTYVIPQFGPESAIEQRRLFTVQRMDGPPPGGLQSWLKNGRELAQALVDTAQQLRHPDLAVGFSGGLDLARALWDAPRGQRMVFLKQFPDVVDGSRACYQAVVEADIRITGEVTGALSPGRWEVTIDAYDSHRIVDSLGLITDLRDGRRSSCTPLAQGFARFSACVDEGRVIWEA